MSNGEPQVFTHPHHVENLAKGNIHFVLKLYKQCVADSTENALLSPLSVSVSLAMALVGARGETATRVRDVLCSGLPGEDINVHAAFDDVLESLRNTRVGQSMNVSNRVYVHEELKLIPDFCRLLDKYYGASVLRFNFAHDAERARLEVNHDVVDATQWKVRDLIRRGHVTLHTRLLAVSSLYFKGEWGSKFKPMQTKASSANFHLGVSGRSIAVDMMQQRAEFRIAVCDEVDSTIVELPFSSQRISMYVFLPKEVGGLVLLENKLTPDVLAAIFAGMRRARVTVTLPRFRLSSCYCLQESLVALGLANLFHPGQADLGGMTSCSSQGNAYLHMGGLLLKTFVDVNEEGSEAGAATALSITTATTRAEPEFTQYFVADHPFLFMIRDNLSGMILFVGRLVSPTVK